MANIGRKGQRGRQVLKRACGHHNFATLSSLAGVSPVCHKHSEDTDSLCLFLSLGMGMAHSWSLMGGMIHTGLGGLPAQGKAHE